MRQQPSKKPVLFPRTPSQPMARGLRAVWSLCTTQTKTPASAGVTTGIVTGVTTEGAKTPASAGVTTNNSSNVIPAQAGIFGGTTADFTLAQDSCDHTPKTLRLLTVPLLLLVLMASLSLSLFFPPTTVTALPAGDNLNFQARLQLSSGAVVPDGYYNIQFKLYDASSAGTLLWTETRTNTSGSGQCAGPNGSNDCRVRVANGYISVYLGAVTSFPTTMPWDQQLYLTMNIGGNTTTPSWDGEMNPRLRLTSVPYAQRAKNADSLLTTNGSYQSTLTIQAPTVGNQVFQIQDQGAAGTYNLLTAPSGSDGYVKLQGGTPDTQQTGHFNISGTGIAANLQGTTSVATPAIRPITDSTTALQIQNAAGSTTIMNFDTTNGRVGIGKNDPTSTLDIMGDVRISSGAVDSTSRKIISRFSSNIGGTQPGTYFQNYETNQATILQARPNGSGVGSGMIFTASSTGTSHHMSIGINASAAYINSDNYLASSSRPLVFSTKLGEEPLAERMRIAADGNIGIGTATISARLHIVSGVAAVVGTKIQGAASQSADLLQYTDANGAVLSGVNANGGLFTYGTNNTFAGLTAPAFTTASTGTSYYYVITATNAAGETVKSTSLGMADNTSTLQWNQVNGATGYKIYRNTTDAFTSGSLLRTTITNGTTTSFTDTGAATSAGLPPTAPTGNKFTIQAWSGQTGNLMELQNSAGSNMTYFDSVGRMYVLSTGLETRIGSNSIQLRHGTGGNNTTVIQQASNDQLVINVGDSGNYNGVRIMAPNDSGTALNLRTVSGHSGILLGLQNASGINTSGFDNTGNLFFINGSRITINAAAQSADYTLSLPTLTANDTICVAGLANCANSTMFIQNQNASQQTANQWISGTARADTSVLTPTLDTATATVLSIATTNATEVNINQSTVLAAGKSITITGGNTASRPASPTEGMVYFDTTTKQLLTYANGKWQADRSTATKIVAASNSSQAIKDSADYVTDGTDDQVEVNAALTAAAGGKVYLSEGTYVVSASISIPNNTTVIGAGRGTVISIPNAQNGSYDIITNTTQTNGTGVVIRDLKIDGNKSGQTSGSMTGIRMSGIGSGTGNTAVLGANISNVVVQNIYGIGVGLINSHNSTVQESAIQTNNTYGVYLSGSNYNTIGNNLIQGNGTVGYLQFNNSTGNVFEGNIVEGSGTSGVSIGTGSVNTVLTGNIVSGSGSHAITIVGRGSIISGNTVKGSAGVGIIATGAVDISITGNTITDALRGINLQSSSGNVAISANTISGSTEYGIYIYHLQAM